MIAAQVHRASGDEFALADRPVASTPLLDERLASRAGRRYCHRMDLCLFRQREQLDTSRRDPPAKQGDMAFVRWCRDEHVSRRDGRWVLDIRATPVRRRRMRRSHWRRHPAFRHRQAGTPRRKRHVPAVPKLHEHYGDNLRLFGLLGERGISRLPERYNA